MMVKSFRVIDIASKLRVKNQGWMKDSGSRWPWHIIFWDNSPIIMPRFLVNKKMFGWMSLKDLRQKMKEDDRPIENPVIQTGGNPTVKEGMMNELI
tara:strand:+ start:204 stop:491 length:288 start_codon:yes stop_codon:yes gene_type:complete